jgi:hypothetical protein
MIELDVFLPKILPRVEGAARPAVYDAIRVAAQEFCTRTRLWRETDTLQTVSDDLDIVAVPQGAVLFEIESARFEGHELEPQSISWLDDNVARWRESTADMPRHITQTEPDTVRLVPMATGTLDLSLYLKPADDAGYLPDWMGNHYKQVIADGALAELLTMPGQAYTSPELAMFYSDRFDKRVTLLSSANLKGQQKARVRTKPHFF